MASPAELLNAASRGSIEALNDLSLLLAVEYSADLAQRTLIVYEAHLDPRHLPSSTNDGRTEHHSILELACTSLRCMSMLISNRDFFMDRAMFLGVSRIWPKIWPWTRYFLTNHIRRNNYDQDNSNSSFSSFKASLGILCVLARQSTICERMASTDGCLEILSKIWLLEVSDPNLCPMSNRLAIMGAVNALQPCLNHLLLQNPDVVEKRFMTSIGVGAEVVALTALTHIQQDLDDSNPNLLESLINSVSLLRNISIYPPLRHALLAGHSVRTIMLTLDALTSHKYNANTTKNEAKCILQCFWYLRIFLGARNGVDDIIEALDAQLLVVLLKSASWLPIIQENSEAYLPIITQILPKYLIYHTVVQPVARSLQEIRKRGLEDTVEKSGEFWDAWSRFTTLADERLLLLSIIPGMECCHNEECRKININNAFQRCSTCREAVYCSRQCQKHDWKHGTHKIYCKKVSIREPGEYSLSISRQGHNFISAVLRCDLKSKMEEVKQGFTDCPSLMAYADYTTYPVAIKFMDGRSFIPDDEENLSTPPGLEWDRAVAETGYKEGEGKLICRVIIPESQASRRALLRVMDILT